jgi:hypothetical protein
MKASTHCLPVPGHARGLHPNIKIVPTASGPQPSYRRALRAHLASGNGLDDIQAVALG